MTAESTCVMYEQLYTPAFKIQRLKFDIEDVMSELARGALQCDAFTGNAGNTHGHELRRQSFSENLSTSGSEGQ